jgi:hypothetical protein
MQVNFLNQFRKSKLKERINLQLQHPLLTAVVSVSVVSFEDVVLVRGFCWDWGMDPTRFDEFLKELDVPTQIDAIKTRLLSADPIIESVKALRNVVRGNSKPDATALLCAYGFPLTDASALAGLLVPSQGQFNLPSLSLSSMSQLIHRAQEQVRIWSWNFSISHFIVSNLDIFEVIKTLISVVARLNARAWNPWTPSKISGSLDNNFRQKLMAHLGLPNDNIACMLTGEIGNGEHVRAAHILPCSTPLK